MEVEGGSPLTEEPPPFMTKAPSDSVVQKTAEVEDILMEGEGKDFEQNGEAITVSQEKTKKESDDDIPKIAITPAMSVTDLVEQLMSHMDPQQRKQFASAIQSKVAIDDTTSVDSSSTIVTSTTTTAVNTSDNCVSNVAAVTADIPTSVAVSTPDISTATVSAVITHENKLKELLPKEAEHEVGVQTEFVNATSKIQSCEDRSVESEIPKLKSEILEKKRKARKRKMVDSNELVKGKKITRKMKRREVGFGSNNTIVQCSNVDELTSGKKMNSNANSKRQMPLSSRNLEDRVQKEEKKCKGRKKQEERKKFIAEKKFPAKKLEKKRIINKNIREGSQEFVSSVDCGESNDRIESTHEDMVNQIKEFHLNMKRKVNEQLKIVIEQISKQFANLELNLGERKSWDLPWYHLNWKEVTQRFAIPKLKFKLELKILLQCNASMKYKFNVKSLLNSNFRNLRKVDKHFLIRKFLFICKGK